MFTIPRDRFQTSRVISSLCPICGLLYSQGDKDDEASHRRFHSRFLDGLPVGRISQRQTTFQEAGRSVIYIDEKSPEKQQDLVRAALDRASLDLGEAPPLPDHWKCYLLHEKTAITGFALTTDFVPAYLDGTPEKRSICPIGVLRLWVVAKHRRCGIATVLVDAARHHHSQTFPRCMVAFSEPTDAGLAFARFYSGTDPFVFDIAVDGSIPGREKPKSTSFANWKSGASHS